MAPTGGKYSFKGHRRIGVVLPTRYGTGGRHLWITGYLGAQWSHGLKPLPPFFHDTDVEPPEFTKWLTRHRPDAIIGLWPDLPLAWLRKAGVVVPRDIAYATLDLADSRGKIAGIVQDNRTIGAAAMGLIAEQLFRNDIGVPATPTVTMVEGIWMDGATVA